MQSGILLVFLSFTLVQSVKEQTKSPKKGLVIPYWPRHFCHDFEAFSTVSWWYNYHTYKEVYEESAYWCQCYNNGVNEGVPKNKTVCFPEDPQVKFVPMVYGEGYGNRPDLEDDPDIAADEWIFLGYNEPDQSVQSNIPALDAAMLWKELEDKYPDKVYHLIKKKMLIAA